MASEVHPKVLEDVVRGILREATASGTEITARSVRAACERKLGLPADGLVSRKEELMALISCALNDLQQQSGVDAAAVLEVQNALADLDTGPTHAALLVAELTGEGTGGGDAVKAMALLAEACATSESASRRLLDAGVVGPLAMSISPEMPKAAASVALRMLSAMALHATLTEQLVRSSALPPLLSRLSVSIDGVGVQCATLVHNLADAPATRMRLLHAGTLRVLTRVIVEARVPPSHASSCSSPVSAIDLP